jgi:hypothetical protein
MVKIITSFLFSVLPRTLQQVVLKPWSCNLAGIKYNDVEDSGEIIKLLEFECELLVLHRLQVSQKEIYKSLSHFTYTEVIKLNILCVCIRVRTYNLLLIVCEFSDGVCHSKKRKEKFNYILNF